MAVYAAALVAGATMDQAYRLAVANHPVNWPDYAGVRVWCCDGTWLATWTHDGGVGPDQDAL